MRNLLALVAGAVLIATCAGNDTADTVTTTLTTADQTTTTASPDSTTTTAPDSTTTTAGPTTTVMPATTTTVDDPLAPEGSGCTPGDGALPDGLWYGEVADFNADGIAFDLACWFSGDAATAAAAEDGEESPPPNDYYVRNQNEQLRELEIDPDTSVLWYLSGDPNDSEDGTFIEWVDFLETQEFHLGIWVMISDGEVSGIEEQWVP